MNMSEQGSNSVHSENNDKKGRDLFSAAQKGDLNTLKKVLNSGRIDPDVKSKSAGQDRSPLHIACGYGQHTVVAELLKAGADPCALSTAGRTPLHDACQGGHSQCVELLVDFDVDVDCQDKNGMAPIHIAAYQGELDCVRTLADKGADLRIINTKGQEPSHLAVQRNHVDIVKYLFEKSIDLEATCFQGRQPLHYAALHGALESLVALVERNCDIDIGDNNGCLPAHLAAKMDKIDCLRFLVKQGCTFDMVQNEGKSFAHLAAQNGSYKCLHWLLEKGYDPNITDDMGNTAGHCAAEKGHADCFNCYFQHRGSVKILNHRRETPVDTGRRSGIPIQMEKATVNEIECPQCTIKNRKLEWDRNHQPAPVENEIKRVGQTAYSNLVTFQKPSKIYKPKTETKSETNKTREAEESGRVSKLSNFSNLFITEGQLPTRDIITKFYGSYLNEPIQKS